MDRVLKFIFGISFNSNDTLISYWNFIDNHKFIFSIIIPVILSLLYFLIGEKILKRLIKIDDIIIFQKKIIAFSIFRLIIALILAFAVFLSNIVYSRLYFILFFILFFICKTIELFSINKMDKK